jgi:hypothetical protein
MGGIVKSIGKTVKKIGKGISKFLKKIGPALILAAAIWAGVSVFGAFSQGTLAGGGIFKSIFSTQNFGAGLTAIGKGIGNALMPGTPFGSVMQQGVQAAVQDGGGLPDMSQTAANMPRTLIEKAGDKDMSTSQALMYMTKMNLLATGFQTLAGLLDDSDEKEAALKYAYGGAVSEGAKKWVKEHPTYMDMYDRGQDKTGYSADWFQEQVVGEPTLGRQSTKQFTTKSPSAIQSQSPGAYKSKGTGLITQGTQKRFA